MGIKKHVENRAQDLAIQNLNSLNLPKSLLIIPDGNGRWAKQAGVSVYEGHKAGGKTISEVLKHFLRVDIDVLGIWGFSEDNWKRPKEEITKIMEVIKDVAEKNLSLMIKNNVKFIGLGRTERLKTEFPRLYSTINKITQKTSQNTGKKLVLFVDYGERFQLEEFAKARKIDKNSGTYELLSKINKGLPLFDMVLRTSGEQRLSGFGPLISLAEFVFVDKTLPELTDRDIIESLRKYSNRQRRFGGR